MILGRVMRTGRCITRRIRVDGYLENPTTLYR